MNESNQITKKDIKDLSKEYGYTHSLVEHWVTTFGLNKTRELLTYIRKPYSSIWVQVNESRIDVDSLIEIFEELDFDVKKNPFFEDILELEVHQYDLSSYDQSHPKIVVDRESAQSIAVGKDVFSYGVLSYDEFKKGEKIEIVDRDQNLIAIAEAEVNSSEIPTLQLNIVARVKKSWGLEPPITELGYYRRGYYNILTPPQVIGVKSLYLDSLENILVMSVDKGDVAGYIAELTEHKSPITVLAQNIKHVRAIRKQMKRFKSKAIRVVSTPFMDFVKAQHTLKYTSVYMELSNSRTAVIPSFTSNLSLNRLKKMVKTQKQIIENLYHCLHPNASISNVNHSLDVLENEQLFNAIISKTYFEAQAFPSEIRELQKRGVLGPRQDTTKFVKVSEVSHKSSTIFLDPIKTENTGGYISKFKLVLRKRT
ncbi:MAG: PUA domain-containing protein [Candidatus Heimdallarchaeaceae archaeon]